MRFDEILTLFMIFHIPLCQGVCMRFDEILTLFMIFHIPLCQGVCMRFDEILTLFMIFHTKLLSHLILCREVQKSLQHLQDLFNTWSRLDNQRKNGGKIDVDQFLNSEMYIYKR
jgi:hypothetical protein